MNILTINTSSSYLYLRTTENTYEVKTSRHNNKYISLSYDITDKDTNEIFRLKVYVNLTEQDTNNPTDDYFAIAEAKGLAKIKEHIKSDNTLLLQERCYHDNTYYTLYKKQKGRQQL